MMRRVAAVVLMAVVAVSLTACGRKGRPIAPEGSIERTYPNIQFPESQSQGSENTTR
ncbi:MAG: hypothetical protein H7Y60_02310 [Rhodospirillaceae bacterium]|nr:hypothetical protein [Rhodospirillales bacterium]